MKLEKSEIHQIIITIIGELMPRYSDNLTADKNLQDLGFDSLRLMNLVVTAEDKIGVQLKDIYLTSNHLKTIDSLANAFLESGR